MDPASGTDIYQESGKTVFGNWLQLKPGQTQTAAISYRLPFSLRPEGQKAFYYSLLAQKQIGDLHSEIISQLKLTDNYKILGLFPNNLEKDGLTIRLAAPLNTDQFYGVVLTAN